MDQKTFTAEKLSKSTIALCTVAGPVVRMMIPASNVQTGIEIQKDDFLEFCNAVNETAAYIKLQEKVASGEPIAREARAG